ncbi:PAS domain-containing sensor histidine kinase [Desertivirga arenae]|uniref:PAS domain-containing sensor histidine kinase n=1 Tax=Desertivirga arenae TaxID=2810309 RepID=UPI001A959BC9|nr:PAS domain-containing sensor histidine kinase [Pedobacter sp. SYSU D00823]
MPSLDNSTSNSYYFLEGGGEMGELIRSYNWAASPVGPPSSWPQSLRTTLAIMLRSAFPMFIFWGKDHLCFYNDAYRPSLGNNGKHPAIGKSAIDVWPEIWHFIGPLIHQVISTGKAAWFEDHYLPIFRNGKLEDVYWTFSYSPIYGDQGTIEGVLVTCTETTEKVNNHLRLIESEKRFQRLIREATIGIIILIGPEMTVQDANSSYCALINKRAEELIGKPLFDVIPETAENFLVLLRKVRETGEPLYLCDCPYFVLAEGLKKEGFLNIVYQPYREDDGRISGVVAMCQDVTEQVIAKKKLQESEAQFQLMANSIVQMIWVTDPQGMHEWYNQRWYDFTGASIEETEGEGWSSMFHPDDRERAWEKWRYSLSTGHPYEVEYRLRKKTGEYVWVLGRAEPIFNSEGKITRWFGTCTDINEQKKLQKQKEEFISIASHELKTPLTSLKASLQIMQREFNKEEHLKPILTKMLKSSNVHADKLSRLVNDLLDVTKIDQGQLVLNKTSFILRDLAKSCSETIQLGTSVNIELSGDLDVEVFGDYQKLEQVLINLLSNSIKYARTSEKILICAERINDFIKVSVEDFGPGIPKEKQEHLFGIYYRADPGGHQYSGLGLGLYICSTIVENHGGLIGVESELGKGSTFWFTIPMTVQAKLL